MIVGDQGNDGGQRIVIHKIGGADGFGGNLPLPEGPDPKRGGFPKREAVGRKDPGPGGRSGAVRRIAQHRAFRRGGRDGDAFMVEASGGQKDGSLRPRRKSLPAVLRAAGRVFEKAVVPTAPGQAVADAPVLGRELQTLNLLSLRVGKEQGFPARGNGEIRIEGAAFSGIDALIAGAPDRQVFPGLQPGPLRETPFQRIFLAVAQMPAGKIHGRFAVIVQLHPVPGMSAFKETVGGHDLADQNVRGGAERKEQRGEEKNEPASDCLHSSSHAGAAPASSFSSPQN